MSLNGLVKYLNEDDFKVFQKEFPDKWQNLNKKLGYPYEYFSSIKNFEQKPFDNLKKEDFFSKLQAYKQMS